MELTNTELNALAQAARDHVRLVSRSKAKEILIFQTKKGIVALRLIDANVFTVTTQGLNAKEIFRGDLPALVPFLMFEIFEVVR